MISGRATGGGDAKAAAMLNTGRVGAGAVAGAAGGGLVVCEGLPPLPETAHEPTMVLVQRGAVGGGAGGSPVPEAW